MIIYDTEAFLKTKRKYMYFFFNLFFEERITTLSMQFFSMKIVPVKCSRVAWCYVVTKTALRSILLNGENESEVALLIYTTSVMTRSTSARHVPEEIKKEELALLFFSTFLKWCYLEIRIKEKDGSSSPPISFYHTQLTCLSCLFCRPRSRFQLRYEQDSWYSSINNKPSCFVVDWTNTVKEES